MDAAGVYLDGENAPALRDFSKTAQDEIQVRVVLWMDTKGRELDAKLLAEETEDDENYTGRR